jgi:hypothetical protein
MKLHASVWPLVLMLVQLIMNAALESVIPLVEITFSARKLNPFISFYYILVVCDDIGATR